MRCEVLTFLVLISLPLVLFPLALTVAALSPPPLTARTGTLLSSVIRFDCLLPSLLLLIRAAIRLPGFLLATGLSSVPELLVLLVLA